MVVELKEALEVVERNREAIQAQLEEEEKEYIASTAVVTLQIPGLLSAVATEFSGSEEEMGLLGSSEKAMRTLGKSEKAMDNLGKSEEAMDNLAKSTEAMRALAKSEEAISKLGNAVKDDPAMFAKLLAILGIAKPGDTDSRSSAGFKRRRPDSNRNGEKPP